MRIGIFPTGLRANGGIYQYGLTMINALQMMNLDDELILLYHSTTDIPLDKLKSQGWKTVPLGQEQSRSLRGVTLNVLRRLVGDVPIRQAWRYVRRRFLPQSPAKAPGYLAGDFDTIIRKDGLKRWFNRQGIELMIYPDTKPLSFEIDIPYIIAVHDLQHCIHPEFPEVSANGEWEQREYVFRNSIRNAEMILVDSEVGKEDVLEFYGKYGVASEKVKVLPFLPALRLNSNLSDEEKQRVRNIYNLPAQYLFYPAQFWPHKNHRQIVHASSILKKRHHLDVQVVLVGSYTGEIMERTFQEVKSLASRLGVEQQIHCLGYVTDEDMSVLYTGALALIMPTIFGPTNIPIVEAWACECPVITSNIRGIREQVGDAAILVDPQSATAIAEGIYRLWTDERLRSVLIGRGRQRLSSYSHEDYCRRLKEILEETKTSVRYEFS